ncbi:hypothetical protein Tco_0582006 [Tanacetum coccineum]
MIMDPFTKISLWILDYTHLIKEGVADKELSDAEEANNDDEQETSEIFRIETNLFNYETPLYTKFKEFNFLFKVDPELFTHDIERTKTYEDYENELNDELEEPWSKDRVPYEICEEYVAIEEHEYDDLTKTNEDACRAYQEIFRSMDEGSVVFLYGDLTGKEIDKVVIMEYLVKISKKARILELKRRHLKITILTSYTPTFDEDVVEHIAKVLDMLNLIKIPNVDSHRLCMKVFPLSLADDARQWWIDEGDSKITTWKELVEKFFYKFYPLSRDGEDEMLEEDDNQGIDPLEFISRVNSTFKNYRRVDGTTQKALLQSWINEGWNKEPMNDIVSSDKEWEESDYVNPPNTTTDSFFKP